MYDVIGAFRVTGATNETNADPLTVLPLGEICATLEITGPTAGGKYMYRTGFAMEMDGMDVPVELVAVTWML
jgi:hypothetical protein